MIEFAILLAKSQSFEQLLEPLKTAISEYEIHQTEEKKNEVKMHNMMLQLHLMTEDRSIEEVMQDVQKSK